MHDFKHHDYDASVIICEYNNALSGRQEVKDNERKKKELHDQIAALNKECSFWQVTTKHPHADLKCIFET
ncbi:MAG: hypothetical protein H0X50_12325 [Nitrosopumilus sp.]|nr:hypothetical protein [Nitrosopumilus sp.]